MSIVVIVELIVTFMACIFYSKFYHGNNKRELIIIMFLIVTCINLGVNAHYTTHYMTLWQELYIPLIAILLAMIFITNFNLKKCKPTLDIYLISIILGFNLIVFCSGQIGNAVKFFNIIVVYICALLIGFVFKFLKGYDYRKITSFVSYIAIVNGILSIAQYITNKKLLIGQFDSSIEYQQSGVWVKRVVGFAGTNNAAGDFGIILFAIVLFNFLRTREKKHLIALAFTFTFSALTLTRIGYVGIGIITITYLLLFHKEGFKILKRKKVAIFILIAVAVVLFALFGHKAYEVLFVQRGDTHNSRIIQYKSVYNKIIQYNGLFHGIGAGQFQYHLFYHLNRDWDIDIHSQYLNIIAENGWAMVFVFLAFNITVLVRAFKRCDTKLEKGFLIGLFVANFVCCNSNPNQDYFVNNMMYYFAMYIFMYKTKPKSISICK